jgi:hypothetical protein
MRYLILFLIGTLVIYAGFLISFTGPQFALTAQPVYSAVLSAFALLAALLVGLPTRFAGVARVWHHTPLGVSIVLLAIILGWIAIVIVFTAAQRATVGNAILGLSGIIAIDFGILHWPRPNRPNQALQPTAGRSDE